MDAYARGLAEYLLVCERESIDPVAATRAQIALFVKELRTRPSLRGPKVVVLDSGSGLANATLQQRLVPVRLFYDFLVEEGVRASNPVSRGRYTAGRGFDAGQSRPLVARMVRLPWIPGEAEWLRLLEVFRLEPIRNRLMLAGLRFGAAPRGAVLAAHRRPGSRAPHPASTGENYLIPQNLLHHRRLQSHDRRLARCWPYAYHDGARRYRDGALVTRKYVGGP
jgi:integrase/recombinase XerD